MESAQNEYQKKMAEEAQKQYSYYHSEKQKNKDKPSLCNCSPLKPNSDVPIFKDIVMKIKTVKP